MHNSVCFSAAVGEYETFSPYPPEVFFVVVVDSWESTVALLNSKVALLNSKVALDTMGIKRQV